MNDYTPGPWNVVDSFYESTLDIQDESGRRLGLINQYYPSTLEANANLISAAPELLEALRDCAEELHIRCLEDKKSSAVWETLKKARAAIHKAEGERS